MHDLESARLIAATTLGLSAYFLPTSIALARFGRSARRVALLNTFAGWTVVGWFWALVCALRNGEDAAAPGEPRSPTEPMDESDSSPRLYEDGSYLISQAGCARTWAVFADGRWGVVYELDDTQRGSAWVEPDDIPLDVLARALHDSREARR